MINLVINLNLPKTASTTKSNHTMQMNSEKEFEFKISIIKLAKNEFV
jgi:hypothetical protein